MKLSVSESAGIGDAIFVIALVAMACYGWVANIFKLIDMDFAALTGMLVVRIIGVFISPLGAVMGYL